MREIGILESRFFFRHACSDHPVASSSPVKVEARVGRGGGEYEEMMDIIYDCDLWL